MKKRTKRQEYTRAECVIQADKSVMSDGCKALVLQDFSRLFDEYFELERLPEMDIFFENGKYRVQITFEADRVKKFNVLK